MEIEHNITTNTRMSCYRVTDDDGQVYEATLNWMDGRFEDSEVILEDTNELADDDVAERIVEEILNND